MAEKNPQRTGKFYAIILLEGIGGHSSMPYKTHNPITSGFEFINIITGRLWYEFSSFDNVALFPVAFQAGTKNNIIPETARLGLYGEYAEERQYGQLKNIIIHSLETLRSLYQVDFKVEFQEAA